SSGRVALFLEPIFYPVWRRRPTQPWLSYLFRIRPLKRHHPGYNILFVLVDQEHFFDKLPFPVPGREYLKKNGTTFLNHQGASQVCSSARSVIYTGQHIQHTGVFDNMEAPWQRDMATDKVTIGDRLRKLGYHTAYQGKWHLSGNVDTAHHPV